jgi:two-component system, cell cycle sensor histidine kinase and response regulator CckA
MGGAGGRGGISAGSGSRTRVRETRRREPARSDEPSARWYRALFEQSNDAVILHYFAGKIIDVNRRACTMLGYSREQLLQKSVADLHATDPYDPTSSEARQFRHDGSMVFERELKRSDGETIAVEVSASLIDQRREIIQGVMRDVTERKRIEQALRNSEAQHRAIIEAMGDGIHVVDSGLRVVMVNSALRRWHNSLGLTPRLVGRSIFDIYRFLSEKVRREYEQVFETSRTVVTEEKVVVNGQELFTETRKIPIRDGARVTHVVTVLRDLTEHRRAERRSRRAQEHLRQMQHLESLATVTGGVAHDFNNLLTAILGNAELALGDAPKGSETAGQMREIIDAANRAAQLTSLMCACAGKGAIAPDAVNLSNVVKEIGEAVRSTAGDRISVDYQLHQSLPTVQADPSQLRQLIIALVRNAAEAIGDEAGRIAIATGTAQVHAEDLPHPHASPNAQPGLYVRLSVTDDGCGMDKETLARLFDPFFSTKFLGRGLGAAAALGIARRHGGLVRARSTPAKGTTLTVLLPCGESKTA